jgi:hypothetical protein
LYSAAVRVGLVLLVTVGATSHAQGTLSFRCTFGPGASASWDSESVQVEKGNFGGANTASIFDTIDLKGGTGRHIGSLGSSDLVVMASSDAITLFEQTDSGNLIFTTIFRAISKQNGKHIAVTSRHMSIL